MASPCHAAAGFAIDRLEGDSIKKESALHTAWGSVGGTASVYQTAVLAIYT